MIRTSAAIAAAAILLSLLVHGLMLTLTARDAALPPAPEAETEVVALGNAFEDVAETVSDPVEPAATPPVETPPEPQSAVEPTSQALVASPDPQQVRSPDAATAEAPQPETTTPEPAQTAEGPAPSGADPQDSAQPPAAAEPEPAETPPVEPEQLAALSAPTPPVAPSPETTEVPVVPTDPEVTEAEPEETELAVLRSPRPRLPDRRPSPSDRAAENETPQDNELRIDPSQVIESPITAYQRGGGDLIVRENRGRQSASIDLLGSGGAGNSTITNYAGRVLVHLNRTPPVHIVGRGFARVHFEINPDGSLAWVDAVVSAGSRDIMRAAELHVRTAAPFPRPPDGKSHRLVFTYQNN